jgi:hypothetical protein
MMRITGEPKLGPGRKELNDYERDYQMGNKTEDSAQQAVDLVKALRGKLSPYLTKELNESAFFVDLADIYEACTWYVETMGRISDVSLTRDELETVLIDIDVNMLEHLNYHLDSLKKSLPAVLNAISLPEDMNP